MANKEITSQDVHDLVEAKARDPHISMEDIFRKVDSVRPNYNRALWKFFWIPIVLYLLSIIGMLFIEQGVALFKLSLLLFIFSSLLAVFILKRFDIKWWWIIPLDLLVLYVIFADVLTVEGIIKLIQKVL